MGDEGFKEFLVNQSAEVVLTSFLVNICLTALLAWILMCCYVRFGHSLSNRRAFGGNFVMIAVTTMLIITIVKSSLALSLGLVGALSIVRFRTAIKEPEELAYIFITIAIGLGFGANQREVTLIGFAVLGLLILLRYGGKSRGEWENLYVTVTSRAEGGVDLKEVSAILKDNCEKLNLRRFDEEPGLFEASYSVEFRNSDNLMVAKEALKAKYADLKISFLDSHRALA